MRIHVQERVRWSDIDAAGVMYFGRYVRLFEIGETELFRSMGYPYNNDVMDSSGVWFLRVSYESQFRKPLVIDNLVDIRIGFSAIKTRSAVMEFECSCDGEVVCTGTCTIVSVDRTSRKSIAIPPNYRTAMERFQTDQNDEAQE